MCLTGISYLLRKCISIFVVKLMNKIKNQLFFRFKVYWFLLGQKRALLGQKTNYYTVADNLAIRFLSLIITECAKILEWTVNSENSMIVQNFTVFYSFYKRLRAIKMLIFKNTTLHNYGKSCTLSFVWQSCWTVIIC